MWKTSPEPFILTASLDCREIARCRGQYTQLQPGRLDPVGLPKKVMVAEYFFVVDDRTLANVPSIRIKNHRVSYCAYEEHGHQA